MRRRSSYKTHRVCVKTPTPVWYSSVHSPKVVAGCNAVGCVSSGLSCLNERVALSKWAIKAFKKVLQKRCYKKSINCSRNLIIEIVVSLGLKTSNKFWCAFDDIPT